MILHHFTHLGALPMILQDGALNPAESYVGSLQPDLHPVGFGVGPDVVWLIDQAEPDFDGLYTPHGLETERQQIRFTVDVRAVRWLDWAAGRDMNPVWRDHFIEVGGGRAFAEHWYVWPAAIRRRRWLEIRDMYDGREIAHEIAKSA